MVCEVELRDARRIARGQCVRRAGRADRREAVGRGEVDSRRGPIALSRWQQAPASGSWQLAFGSEDFFPADSRLPAGENIELTCSKLGFFARCHNAAMRPFSAT